MDPQSPPKRMTRARAAAKAGDPAAPKTTKIVTAAAKAKAAPSSTRATASSKRKAKFDDNEDDEQHDEAPQQTDPAMRATRPTRGRPKKTVEEPAEEASNSAAGLARATRGRAKKPAPETPVEEPVRARGRPRKIQPEEKADALPEPAKKTTRGRAATLTASKPATKKSVTFEEPEKENIAPDGASKAKDKAPATVGLRGRPVRKPAVPTRATRAAVKSAPSATEKAAKTPLSPKKVTQMPVSRECSEDELASTEKTPLKPMMKSPMKLPASILGSIRKPIFEQKEAEADLAVHNVAIDPPEIGATQVLGSPARRPPSSPYKDAMKSPARRVDGLSALKPASAMKANGEGSTSSFKSSLLQSPAKRSQSAIKGFGFSSSNRSEQSQSPFKTSFLQSPAKRPVSPIKGLSMPKRQEPTEMMQSPATKPLLLSTPTALPPMQRTSERLMSEERENDEFDQISNDIMLQEPPRLHFPGRLSAVLPRHADPALKANMLVLDEASEDEVSLVQDSPKAPVEEAGPIEEVTEDVGEPMIVDEPEFESTVQEASSPTKTTTPPQSPPKQAMGIFGLRQKDMDPYEELESDSEDELAQSARRGQQHHTSAFCAVPATPTPAASGRRSLAKASTRKIGFTPLAQQFGAWSAASPVKAPRQLVDDEPTIKPFGSPANSQTDDSPMRSTFFDDEMSVRGDVQAQNEIEAAIEADITAQIEEPDFDEDLLVTEEDMELAAEANEMSLLEPEQLDEIVHTTYDLEDSLSEASQEYGDENEIPIDPAILESHKSSYLPVPPTTPARVLTREFHTVSKVPLKAADDSTPRPKKKRSASISRLPVSRPSGLTRSATVISYSPMKNNRPAFEVEEPAQSAPVTPAKSEVWSTAGTPARTPRRDLNPALLRGAIVFVDVHTSEGADASGIFVELLNQMGARCVKNWSWNPTSPTSSDSSKIGITHVVYKDGGKRTMEKVRESGGVVQCVGVSWVLDCERENEWLDEAPYYIDTSLVPRGGHRRRKSMEPRALANLNGLLVPSPVKGSRDIQTAPNTPMNRRDSTVWIRTPSDVAEDEEQDWQSLLTPVPATPAPEALARYAANLTPETPSGMSSYDDSPTKDALLMRTCPPKPNAYSELGEGILGKDKDEGVLMRLMAARRKSLQFAPKVGSPLAKAWN